MPQGKVTSNVSTGLLENRLGEVSVCLILKVQQSQWNKYRVQYSFWPLDGAVVPCKKQYYTLAVLILSGEKKDT